MKVLFFTTAYHAVTSITVKSNVVKQNNAGLEHLKVDNERKRSIFSFKFDVHDKRDLMLPLISIGKGTEGEAFYQFFYF